LFLSYFASGVVAAAAGAVVAAASFFAFLACFAFFAFFTCFATFAGAAVVAAVVDSVVVAVSAANAIDAAKTRAIAITMIFFILLPPLFYILLHRAYKSGRRALRDSYTARLPW
jgi:hypothetical protein